jgi:hypothetical protein
MLRRLALAAGLISALATPLQGQVNVGLSAFAGGYLPINDLFEEIQIAGRTVSNLGQEPGLLFGGRITAWLSRFAIEAEAGYALSNIDLPSAIVDLGLSKDASVFVGSLNLMYVVFQAPFSPLNIYVSGGAGVVSRSGEFYDMFEGTTDFSGALGVGLRFGIGRAAYLRFDLRDYIYSFAPTRRDEVFPSQTQNDVIATVGLEFVFTPAK